MDQSWKSQLAKPKAIRNLIAQGSGRINVTYMEYGTTLPCCSIPSSCLYSLSWNTVLKERYHLFTTCQRVEGNFLSWLSEPTRGGTPLDLLLTNEQGLVGDVFKGCLGQRDHEMVRVFNTWWCKEGHQQNLDFQRVDFDLFKTLIRKVPWEAAIKNKRGSGRLNIL